MAKPLLRSWPQRRATRTLRSGPWPSWWCQRRIRWKMFTAQTWRRTWRAIATPWWNSTRRSLSRSRAASEEACTRLRLTRVAGQGAMWRGPSSSWWEQSTPSAKPRSSARDALGRSQRMAATSSARRRERWWRMECRLASVVDEDATLDASRWPGTWTWTTVATDVMPTWRCWKPT